MKKALALLLAVFTVGTAGMTSYAEDTKPTDAISLGKDENISLNGALLAPGELYRFPILLTEDGSTAPLVKDSEKRFKISAEKLSGGEGLEYAKIVTVGEEYFFDVKVRAGAPSQQKDAQYKLTYTRAGKTLETKLEFRTGIAYADISGAVAGESVKVSQFAPLYTGNQLEKLAELNSYKRVTFEGDEWAYTANINGMSHANFGYSFDSIKAVADMFPEDDMKYLSFANGGSFKQGELTIDVSDYQDVFGEKVYAYRYLYGRLYKMPSSYNAQDGTITLSVNNLGSYVITDRVIKEATIVDANGGNSGGSGNTTPDTKPNPDTGAGSMRTGASLVVMLSAVGVLYAASSKRRA